MMNKWKKKVLNYGYSSFKGSYIGDKLTMVIDYDICQLLVVLFHPGAVHDSKIFASIFDELKRRGIYAK